MKTNWQKELMRFAELRFKVALLQRKFYERIKHLQN
jgi:hypothetical protein